MRPLRILDVALFLLVAIAVLLPRPDVKVKAALALDVDSKARLAELQSQPAPLSPDEALEMADLLVDGGRPDFAVAVLKSALQTNGADHRLHFRRGLALAEHFQMPTAFQSTARALELCENGSSVPCSDADHARIALVRQSLERIKDIDVHKDANTMKKRLIETLRPSWLRRSRPAPKPAPKPTP
ncbi:MAG: hypothetical protein SGI86_13620 [Deltaproteobacteria bacterium]|nr:hypothetical protein [Deltaproteobacteria bacterium]